MTLDSWLAIKGITRQDFGRLVGVKPTHQIHRWLQFLVCGKPNRLYRPPGPRNQFKIRKLTNGLVNLNDWPDPRRNEE
jgi:hypothetical protein